eukprot:GHVN01074208.1.p1 GENE.GHVN01074208.1~~GHVN01074208.1.p1  ORF type:complete len:494 (-),score=99.22 GHVN01074208.1:117-1598(-)
MAADSITQLDETHNYLDMILNSGHESLPLTVCPSGYCYLETFHKLSAEAAEFITSIAEPVSRPEVIHEFQITVFSLYAAASVGVSANDIITKLTFYSKNKIDQRLIAILRGHGESFGKVKLVLRGGRHRLEANNVDDLRIMLRCQIIKDAQINKIEGTSRVNIAGLTSAPPPQSSEVSDHINLTQPPSSCDGTTQGERITGQSRDMSDPSVAESVNGKSEAVGGGDNERGEGTVKSEMNDSRSSSSSASSAHSSHPSSSSLNTSSLQPKTHSFEIMSSRVSQVQHAALVEVKRPLLCEYDFRRDESTPSMAISLRPSVDIRYYQERALRKMFSNGRARSGIIVLPCGAGKTLTGVTAACTIGKSVLVLTTSAVAVDQWKRSFIDCTTIDPDTVITLTSDSKQDLFPSAGVLVSTYTMIAYKGKRSSESDRIMKQVQARSWGLLIFDEVQFAPAPEFRTVNQKVVSHCKLGLTATLVREDTLIHDLQWLIGLSC